MKTLIPFLILSGFVFAACEKDKENSEVNKISSVRGYENMYIGTFRCGLYVPVNYSENRSYPLVIYLHGYSDTTTWNLEWYNAPITTNDPCIVLTPKCPVSEIYGWGDSYHTGNSPMMEKTFEMLAMVEKAFNLDPERYYIYGTSMGGYGTYGVLQKNPDMFAGAYVSCGNGNISMAPILAEIPCWIFHGSADNVVPVQPDRDLYHAVLEQGGTQIRYTEYEGVGHNVWDYTRYETTLQTWLLAQRKGSIHVAPQAVNGFTAALYEGDKASLNWEVPAETSNPSDNNIWYCRIYRNDIVIKEVYNDQHSFIDSTLVANTPYEYKISAVNYYFKESVLSAPVTITVTK